MKDEARSLAADGGTIASLLPADQKRFRSLCKLAWMLRLAPLHLTQ
jgi:hypothetical protein